MSIRGQLKSLKMLLEETPATPQNAPGLAERVQEIVARIEQQPQFSAVRPATIALRNLIVSLRRPEQAAELAAERQTAIETLGELLDDDTFGVEADDVRTQITRALRKLGVNACVQCKHAELTIEPVYILMKPFPSDPALAASQLPCATIVCKRCGFMWLHDLAVLDVL